jgi:phospholipid/cholesterol/gamma-HCH transport system ATP-binding protein
MTAAALAIDDTTSGGLKVGLSGDWLLGHELPGPDPILDRLRQPPKPGALEFDAQALGDWDTGLVKTLIAIHRSAEANGVAVDDAGLPEGARRLLELAFAVKEREGARRTATEKPWLQHLGESVLEDLRSGRELVDFLGELILSFRRFLSGKATYLKSDVVQHIQEAGAEAFPIVSLISFLIGMIFAFVGVMQLNLFGAGIYTADLVAVAMVREMAAIMTAIIMAGRTGAAYAAQIGTMKVNEEIDALTTLGVNPIDFLVTPRVIALIVMMPLLTMYASLMGGTEQPVRRTVQMHRVRHTGCAGRLSAGHGLRQQRDGRGPVDHQGGGDGHRADRGQRVDTDGDLHQSGHLSMSDKQPHIVATDLTMAYGDFLIQRDLNFTVNHGDVFIIMGGSGCGKSTLLKIMIGLKSPAKGDITFDGKSFWTAPAYEQEQMKRKFGTLFQSGALWSSMTLAENVALPLQQYTDLTAAEIREVCSYKLSLVGLAGFEDFYPNEISGGMKKRAGLARAMAMDPEILFFDEPSAGLDPISAKLLDDLILELRDSLGTTVVVVTHELASIFAIGNNSVFLDPDTKTQLATGDPKELRDHHPNFVVRNFLQRGMAQPETHAA